MGTLAVPFLLPNHSLPGHLRAGRQNDDLGHLQSDSEITCRQDSSSSSTAIPNEPHRECQALHFHQARRQRYIHHATHRATVYMQTTSDKPHWPMSSDIASNLKRRANRLSHQRISRHHCRSTPIVRHEHGMSRQAMDCSRNAVDAYNTAEFPVRRHMHHYLFLYLVNASLTL